MDRVRINRREAASESDSSDEDSMASFINDTDLNDESDSSTWEPDWESDSQEVVHLPHSPVSSNDSSFEENDDEVQVIAAEEAAPPVLSSPTPTAGRLTLPDRVLPVANNEFEDEENHPTSAKRKRLSEEPASEQKPTTSAPEEEGESDDGCLICCEDYTSNGEHRLVSLKCGHFFGRSCIERWIRCEGRAASCPNCKGKATMKDVRVHFARTVRMTDTCELETLKVRYGELERSKNKLEMELTKVKRQLDEYLKNASAKIIKEVPLLVRSGKIILSPFLKSALSPSSQNAGARAFDIFGPVFLIGINQLNQSNGSLFGRYAIRTITFVSNPKPHLVTGQALPLHSNKCRVITVCSFDSPAPLVLSGGEDKKVVVNVMGTSQQRNWLMPDECTVWSACWISKKHFVAGLQNGRIYEFDYSSEDKHPVRDITKNIDRLPIIFLCYEPTKNVLLAASGKKLVAYRGDSVYHLLVPAEQRLEAIRSVAWDARTLSFVVTFQANVNKRKPIVHKLYKLEASDELVGCIEVDTWTTNCLTNTTMWKNALFSISHKGPFSVVYDEDHGCLVAHDWSAQREDEKLTFPSGKFANPTEIKAFDAPTGEKMLAVLTESNLYMVTFVLSE